MEQKNTYYVSVARREILRSGTDSPYEFVVNATDDEITKLRMLFDRNEESEMEGFLTGQMPSVPYHVDKANQESDNLLIKIYRLIGEIGDEEARNHIVTMGLKPPTEEHPFIDREN
ncbi:hydrolase [Jeotgalibacillus haloalkalitolerans]|uniref:Hydrolase n=1 Tax=Jeotgalibacillus haloalkalitolerans TaxID=3104292 RepID=A0ABU5KMR3_9BACL|nr:hydrolase [Jeotgalibacillus sp. HH7-29]MDZ5712553.1 hydrolase [Jeotgalibacillus sp. HH7-29]